MRRLLYSILPFTFFVVLFSACEDDYSSPPQRLDLVEFVSDENGLATKMILDSGDTLLLSHPTGGFQSDTISRCLAVFRPSDKSNGKTVDVTSVGQILTLPPMLYSAVYVDSVDVTSVWMGGNYLNLCLSLRTKGSGHAFGFAYIGMEKANDGAETLRLMLYNNARNDENFFSRTTYLSCALHSVADVMQRGRDSVSITINEYGKGFVTYKLPL